MVDLSIVVPIYNEEGNMIPLYKEIKEVLDQLKKSHEIIFINDGSTDKTEEIINSIKDKNFKSIHFRKNFGQTAAMDAGLKKSRGKIIITMDGDLQHDPKDIPKLLDGIEKGYDIRTVQELMGHSNVQTTMVYTHVAQKNKLGVKSPLDG